MTHHIPEERIEDDGNNSHTEPGLCQVYYPPQLFQHRHVHLRTERDDKTQQKCVSSHLHYILDKNRTCMNVHAENTSPLVVICHSDIEIGHSYD